MPGAGAQTRTHVRHTPPPWGNWHTVSCTQRVDVLSTHTPLVVIHVGSCCAEAPSHTVSLPQLQRCSFVEKDDLFNKRYLNNSYTKQ